MRSLLLVGVGAATIACSALAARAQTFAISIGIRETGTTAPIGGNGGSANGIEWVNLDGQTLTLDGTFQTFTFNFQTDALTGFAGTTANGTYDGTRGVLEHIRIRNTGGVTAPVELFIDNIVNTTQAGPNTVSNFEGFPDGTEVTFQEPRFSGSTTANLALLPNSALTTSTMASEGTSSDLVTFQFLDNLNTRWLRLSTFNTPNLPNPTIEFAPGDRLSFQIKGVIVPEPASASLLAAGAGLLLARRRR
jgi:hypothetical protein